MSRYETKHCNDEFENLSMYMVSHLILLGLSLSQDLLLSKSTSLYLKLDLYLFYLNTRKKTFLNSKLV